jgi:hypothetical protein
MTEEEPKCDYCDEKAVKTVHSYADKDGTPTDHYYCEMIKNIILNGELIYHRRKKHQESKISFTVDANIDNFIVVVETYLAFI